MLVILMRLLIVIILTVDTLQDRQWIALNPRCTMFSYLFDEKASSWHIRIASVTTFAFEAIK